MEHPDTDQLKALVFDTLEESVRPHVEQHVADCDSCQECLQALGAALEQEWDGLDLNRSSRLEFARDYDQQLPRRIAERFLDAAADDLLPDDDALTRGRLHRQALIGSGGLGEVYAYEDEELGRVVAVKVIRGERAASPRAVRRFEREIAIAASLQHPGVPAVHGRGRLRDRRPFYVMQFIEGRELSDEIADFTRAAGARRSPSDQRFRRLLDNFRQVCETIQAAHAQGIVHRDLKPQNIVVDAQQNAFVLDWGLAKRLEDEDLAGDELASRVGGDAISEELPELTSSGPMGSLAYLAPEQARGASREAAKATDVFGLGAVLFHLLTGQPPHTDDRTAPAIGTKMLLERVAAGNLRTARQVESSVPPELDSICRKAMAVSPEDRYATPHELSEEIERWLVGDRVSAHRYSPAAATLRLVRRFPGTTATTAAALFLIAVIVGIAWLTLSRTNVQLAAEETRATNNADAFADLSLTTLNFASDIVARLPDFREGDPQGREDYAVLREATLLQLRDIAKRIDTIQETSRRVSVTNMELGDMLARLGYAQEAFERYLAARQIAIARLDEGGPPEVLYQTRLDIGDTFEKVGHEKMLMEFIRTSDPELDVVIAEFTEARHWYVLASAMDVADDVARQRMALIDSRLGEAWLAHHTAPDHLSNARKWLDSALALQTALLAESPEDAAQRTRLAATVSMLGEVAQRQKDFADAEQYYNRCYQILNELRTEAPDDDDLAIRFAKATKNLGDLARAKGELATAKKYYEDYLQAAESVRTRVESEQAYLDVWAALGMLAMTAFRNQDLDEAERLMQRVSAERDQLVKEERLTQRQRFLAGQLENALRLMREQAGRGTAGDTPEPEGSADQDDA